MKSIFKSKKTLVICIALITALLMLIVFPPLVFIGGKPHWTFSSEISMNQKERNFTNKDVKALKHMIWVKSVFMSGTQITDISFLDRMHFVKNLTLVCSDDYPIYDLAPLSNCNKLERFLGSIPNITDLSSLKELIRLSFLQINISNSKINDISDVKYLVNLEWFIVGGENITDISSLQYCTKLEHISLSGTTADTDYSVLFELPKLNYLAVDKGVLSENEIRTFKERGVHVYERE